MSFGTLLIKVQIVNLVAYFTMLVIVHVCGQELAIAVVGAFAFSCFYLTTVRFKEVSPTVRSLEARVKQLEYKLEQSNSPQ